MDLELINALNESLETGIPLQVIYNSGSQPGSRRYIAPVDVSTNQVKALCISSKVTKVYNFSQLRLVGPDSEAKAYMPPKLVPEPLSLEEAIEPFRTEIESLGWLLKIEPKFAGVFRRFKNGNPRKTPDVYIEFHEFISFYFINEYGEEVEGSKPSSRPWYVSHKTKPASSFKRLGAATEKFLANLKDEAYELGLSKCTRSSEE